MLVLMEHVLFDLLLLDLADRPLLLMLVLRMLLLEVHGFLLVMIGAHVLLPVVVMRKLRDPQKLSVLSDNLLLLEVLLLLSYHC